MAKKSVKKKSSSKRPVKRAMKKSTSAAAMPSEPVRPVSHADSNRQTKAVVGLVLNLVIWPGVGTLVGSMSRKETKVGIVQAVLFLLSFPLMFVVIGFLVAPAVWIWALITSIQQLKAAY